MLRFPTLQLPQRLACLAPCALAVGLLGLSRGLAAQPAKPTQSQQPAASRPTVETPQAPVADPAFNAFVQAVDAAHHEKKAERKFDRFSGQFSITSLEPGQDRFETRLTAKFLAPRLIRYNLEEAERAIELGQDEKGMWTRNGDKVDALTSKEFAKDRKTLRQQLRLARQMLQYLDPANALRSLTDRSPVTTCELKISRAETIEDCRHVRGQIDDFPLFETQGGAHRVQLEIWTKDGLLTALRATPTDDQGGARGRAEFVLLQDHRPLDGISVPTKLTIFGEPEAPGRRQPVARIEIQALDLDPPLDAAAFARPR